MNRGLRNVNYSSGVGYLTIPQGADRRKYVSTCYRKERISIQLEDGGTVIKDCYISKNLLSELQFPKSENELGSAVAFIVPELHDIPIIVAVVSRPGDTQLLNENVFKRVVSSPAGTVSVEMNPEGGLFVNVNSEFEDEANIFITLKSKNNKAKFDVKCFGDMNIYSEGEIALETLKTMNLKLSEVINGIKSIHTKIMSTSDGLVVEDKHKNKIKLNNDGRIILHDGRSPVVKGDVLQAQLGFMKQTMDAFIDTYLTTISAVGAGGPAALATMQEALFLVRNENFDNINSKNLVIK